LPFLYISYKEFHQSISKAKYIVAEFHQSISHHPVSPPLLFIIGFKGSVLSIVILVPAVISDNKLSFVKSLVFVGIVGLFNISLSQLIEVQSDFTFTSAHASIQSSFVILVVSIKLFQVSFSTLSLFRLVKLVFNLFLCINQLSQLFNVSIVAILIPISCYCRSSSPASSYYSNIPPYFIIFPYLSIIIKSSLDYTHTIFSRWSSSSPASCYIRSSHIIFIIYILCKRQKLICLF
jgi:hypothetical protein